MWGIALSAGIIGADSVNRMSFSPSFMLNFLTARLSASLLCRRRTQLGFLHHNSSQMFSLFASVVNLSESNQPKQKHETFTVSYLMNSCGLSAKAAIEVSKRIKLKKPDNPNTVLNLLRSYGFTETQISKFVKRWPPVLLANPENTLLPKLRFFQSIGFSGSELPELLISNSRLLTRSLEKRIIPRYEALKSVIDDEKKGRISSRRSDWHFLFYRVMTDDVVQNIMYLREQGVPQSSVSQLVTYYSNVVFMNPAKFVESVKFVKETGIKPMKATFIHAIYVFAMTKKSTWELKLDIFERWGWSRDVTLLAFSKSPFIMVLSEEKITNSMKFLVDEIGLRSEDIAACPAVLGYSLKQRIIPRCSVVKILKMKDLIKNDVSFIGNIILSEKKFLGRFLIRFQDSVPQLLNIYKSQFGPLPEVQS